mgnify:CR=1 FL=1
MKRALIAASLLIGSNALAGEGDPNLRVIVTNVQAKGDVHVWVYDKKDDWLSDRYRTQKIIDVPEELDGDRVTLELLLPDGEYALSVYQDVNGNGQLERNFVGIPKEPGGLSNNVRPRFGPPKYKDAAFTVKTGTVTEQKIRIE